MNKVYFSKEIEKLLDQLQLDQEKIGSKVGIKVHFGEKGCNTHLDPALAKKVYEKIVSFGKSASLIECNVLYKGSRTNSTDHIQTAREHGFDLPIDILDGEDGSQFIELEGCKIGKGIEKYDSLVVISHFKGHMAAGFGGAIKNLGMGLGSRAGKLDMHSAVNPSVLENCIGCGLCVEKCNANAITIENGKAAIDKNKCEGCAMCIAVCPNHAIEVPWRGRTQQQLQEKIAQYAKAILNYLPKVIFINVLQNITVQCDCMGVQQSPMMPDVGVVYSDDIVAIDKASLDLANKFSSDKFDSINPVDKEQQIKTAQIIHLGSSQYELVEL